MEVRRRSRISPSIGMIHNGKRIKVEEAGKIVYHVFNYLGQKIYEDNLTANEQTLSQKRINM